MYARGEYIPSAAEEADHVLLFHTYVTVHLRVAVKLREARTLFSKLSCVSNFASRFLFTFHRKTRMIQCAERPRAGLRELLTLRGVCNALRSRSTFEAIVPRASFPRVCASSAGGDVSEVLHAQSYACIRCTSFGVVFIFASHIRMFPPKKRTSRCFPSQDAALRNYALNITRM